MDFKDLLAADAETIFLNSNEFGEEIVHTSPDGTVETLVAVIDYDVLDNGPASDDKGTRIRQRAIAEILSTVSVVEERPGGAYPSTFAIDGLIWIAKRIVSKDSATQSVEIHRTDQKATKRV